MDKAEIKKEMRINYLDLCTYLQQKYGMVPCSYFATDTYKTKNSKANSKTKFGLMIHHIKENVADNLGDPVFAVKYPFSYQMPENLVYCNYIEHYLLHMKLMIEYFYPQYNKERRDKILRYTDDPQSLVAGLMRPGIMYIASDLNELYDDDGSKLPWQQNCYSVVKDNFDDYIEMNAIMLLSTILMFKDVDTDAALNLCLGLSMDNSGNVREKTIKAIAHQLQDKKHDGEGK